MIPHRIFYVWFGDKIPASAQMCLRNWQREMASDWEIIHIGKERTPWFDFEKELSECAWLRAVYERGMWAFVADYVRCKVLHTHGGVYLDTDMTLERDFSPLLEGAELFLGWENPHVVNMSICGAVAHHQLLAEMLAFYHNDIWESNLYTIPDILTHVLRTRFGLAYKYSPEPVCHQGITLYPSDYFYPWAYETEYSPGCITSRTYAIHWWGGSWLNPEFDYFLHHKHIPEYDFSTSVINRSVTQYRVGGIRLLSVKEQQGMSRYYLFGFIPFLSVSNDCGRLLGCIPLTRKRKEKKVRAV